MEQQRAYALKQWADASGQCVNALERLAVELGERGILYLTRLNFFVKIYKEHQLKKTGPCAATPTWHKTRLWMAHGFESI